MELAMVGKKEETIVKLFLYIVGSQGREIYETLSFDQEPEEVRDDYNSKQLNNAVGVERKCKYCGGMHEWNKTKCPAYGKECRQCCKLNHFASVCKTKRQTVKKVDTSSDSSDYMRKLKW
jgi:hypothetical protein